MKKIVLMVSILMFLCVIKGVKAQGFKTNHYRSFSSGNKESIVSNENTLKEIIQLNIRELFEELGILPKHIGFPEDIEIPEDQNISVVVCSDYELKELGKFEESTIAKGTALVFLCFEAVCVELTEEIKDLIAELHVP